MPAAFFTTVRNPEPFRRGLIPITLISRPLSLATVQEVLETGGDDEEEKGRKEGTLSEMHLQGVVSRRDSRWMRGLWQRRALQVCVRLGGIGSLRRDGADLR